MSKDTKTALVVMSGGQDSMTCLGVAMRYHQNVLALSFTYGQRHINELVAAATLCAKYEVPRLVIDLSPVLSHMQSALTEPSSDVGAPHPYMKDVPASFVPVRNALFLTSAYGVALEYGAEYIYTGVCETDFSGYPDCRLAFIEALNKALNVGYLANIKIETPLMNLDKAATFALARDVGVLHDVLETTVTCYNGDPRRNEWGKGCGTCPSCKLRLAGWEKYITTQPVAG